MLAWLVFVLYKGAFQEHRMWAVEKEMKAHDWGADEQADLDLLLEKAHTEANPQNGEELHVRVHNPNGFNIHDGQHYALLKTV